MRMISFNKLYVAGPESNQRSLKPQSDSLSMLATQLQCIHEPPHVKTNKMAIASSEDTGKSVHPLSLIRVFAVRMKKNCPKLSTERIAKCEDSDQTGQVPRMIWVFAGHKGHFVGFVMKWHTFRKCILIFANGLRNKPHFWKPSSPAHSTVSLTAEPKIASSSPSPATDW